MVKQEIEENPGFRTTDAQGSRGVHRTKQGDHRDQVTGEGYYAVTRLFSPPSAHHPQGSLDPPPGNPAGTHPHAATKLFSARHYPHSDQANSSDEFQSSFTQMLELV